MNIDEFRQLDLVCRLNKPSLFAMSASDNVATDAQIGKVEKILNLSLPISYKEFLKNYGGGNYCLLTIYSADPQSNWYLPLQYAKASHYLPKDILPISDDFCGGHYVYTIANGIASDRLYYWNTDGGTIRTEYITLYDFIVQEGYS